MAKNDDIERLIAETEASLSGRARPAATPAAARPAGRFESSARVAAISGALAASVVFAAFAILPFFGAFSGAAGAFTATFFIVLAQRITGRRR
ncbi:MAG: hypothetical protein ACT4P1_07105 [Sporichthyaceae bacterium]